MSFPDITMCRGKQKQKVFPVPAPMQWCVPLPNYYKVNWDAAIDKVMCKVEIGVVIRDQNGKVAATLMSSHDLYPYPLLGETFVTLKAVILCIELKLPNIVLESDSLSVVQAIKGVEGNWSSVGLLVRDIQKFLNCLLIWYVCHI